MKYGSKSSVYRKHYGCCTLWHCGDWSCMYLQSVGIINITWDFLEFMQPGESIIEQHVYWLSHLSFGISVPDENDRLNEHNKWTWQNWLMWLLSVCLFVSLSISCNWGVSTCRPVLVAIDCSKCGISELSVSSSVHTQTQTHTHSLGYDTWRLL